MSVFPPEVGAYRYKVFTRPSDVGSTATPSTSLVARPLRISRVANFWTKAETPRLALFQPAPNVKVRVIVCARPFSLP